MTIILACAFVSLLSTAAGWYLGRRTLHQNHRHMLMRFRRVDAKLDEALALLRKR